MKKLLIIKALLLLLFVKGYAAPNDSINLVTMVDYEQRTSDYEATIALRNNSSDTIRNISFIIEYLDMNGNSMDYETFTRKVDINPGMTKKLDIRAYEHDRNYHYFKSAHDRYGASPAFKVRFELKGYNTCDENNSTRHHYGTSDNSHSILISASIVLMLGIWIGLYILVATMAKRRNRNPAVWILLSLIGTPLLMCIILLTIGCAPSRQRPPFRQQ